MVIRCDFLECVHCEAGFCCRKVLHIQSGLCEFWRPQVAEIVERRPVVIPESEIPY